MADSDRDRWNAVYDSRGTDAQAPSEFVVAQDRILPRRGVALDVAGGSGRHAVWLAGRGLEVTLADISDVGLVRARQRAAERGVVLRTQRIDVEQDGLPPGPWDVVVCVDFLWRPMFVDIVDRLVPGGFLVVAHPTRTNLLRHDRPSPHHLLEDGELPGLVSSLEVMQYEEGWAENGRHEARLVARRSQP